MFQFELDKKIKKNLQLVLILVILKCILNLPSVPDLIQQTKQQTAIMKHKQSSGESGLQAEKAIKYM